MSKIYKVRMATIINNDKRSVVLNKDSKQFPLAKLQQWVGGLIESIPAKTKGTQIFVNEEGYVKGLLPNPSGRAVIRNLVNPRYYRTPDQVPMIRGPVVITQLVKSDADTGTSTDTSTDTGTDTSTDTGTDTSAETDQ